MIIKQLKVPKSTVYDTVARFKELGDDKDCPRSGRHRTACTPKIIKSACKRVRRNLKRSIKKMVQEMNISPKTIRTIIKTDLKLSPFKLKKLHQLTDFQKKIKESEQILSSLEQHEGWHAKRRHRVFKLKIVHSGVQIPSSK